MNVGLKSHETLHSHDVLGHLDADHRLDRCCPGAGEARHVRWNMFRGDLWLRCIVRRTTDFKQCYVGAPARFEGDPAAQVKQTLALVESMRRRQHTAR